MIGTPGVPPAPDRRPVVLGIGNVHRHDDAVGLEVVERVGTELGERARIVRYDGESTGLLDLWAGLDLVVLVDAVASRGSPGRFHRFEGDLSRVLAEPPLSSTHGFSVGEAWRLGSALGQLPHRLVVFGIEGEDFTPGIGLSPGVRRALESVSGAIVAEVVQDPMSVPGQSVREVAGA
jgi:hydrogenase maturation protease